MLQIDAWWRQKRLAAPDLFADELAGALTDLAAMPVEDRERIFVPAVWSCFRGRGPKLQVRTTRR